MSSDAEWDVIQNYAPPIQRDGFSYHGTNFYVQAASRRRIHRADASRLHALLTYTAPPPLLTKAGKVAKRQPRPHEDESEEFYAAQVVHYGLPPTTTKAAAKRALLAAFGGKTTLEVPARIVKLAEDMAKEYGAANKVAKARYLEEKRLGEAKEAERRSKRKREIDVAIGEFLQETGNERPVKKGKTQPAQLQANGELSGKFNVLAPFLTEQWEDDTRDPMWLKLCPSSTAAHLWGAFDFGVISGVLRSTAPLPTCVGEAAAFKWRGRESGTGESTFGADNVVRITFLGGGKFRAQMDSELGNFDLAGTKLEGTKGKVAPKSVREWKTTWRGINPRAYERENRARWGGWGGDEDDGERPAGSDTTEGGESDRSEEGFDIEEGYDSGNCAF
ncbi:hypothetical protein FB451DRAFT_1371227 [Mycena latifolia]|nr:hypothetical protein FB451DRAFT_1371227 [Mycena latifolia]